MTRLNPYLRFNGNCREAMQFYQGCLGGDLKLMLVGESPAASNMPPEMNSLVMHSTLEKDGMIIMASDMPGSETLTRGNIVSLCINGAEKETISNYFIKLSQGGRVIHPLKDEFFGTYGDLTDKFGFNWMFQIDKPKS